MILVVILMVLVVAIAPVIFWLFKWEGESRSVVVGAGRDPRRFRSSLREAATDDKVVYICDSEKMGALGSADPIAETEDDDLMKPAKSVYASESPICPICTLEDARAGR